jgi:hypothetical protein
MTILEAALFSDAENTEAAAPTSRPQWRRWRGFHYAAWIQPLLRLAFRKPATTR